MAVVASGGRAERGSRPPARTASVVVPFPRGRSGGRLDPARLLPSGRSLLAAFAILGVGASSYLVARDTSVFALRTLDVRGAPPAVAADVRAALQEDVGSSLLRIDLRRAAERVAALPTVAAVSFDRAFPHTLRVRIVPEHGIAVLRQGADGWLVSARGRVMARVQRRGRPRLPRVWLPKGPQITPGAPAPAAVTPALQAVRPLVAMRFPARVSSVRASAFEVTLVLRSGVEVRLGDATDAALKLAVAARVLPLVPSGTRYVDVSVPGRPVAGMQAAPPDASVASSANTQVSSRG